MPKNHGLVAKEGLIYVERISSSVVPKQSKTILQRFRMRNSRRKVYFKAYFRAPPVAGLGVGPVADMELNFRLIYTPGLQFEWDLSLNGSHFQYFGTNLTAKGSRLANFKVTCQPGSVFPILVAVVDFQRDKPFVMLEILSTKEGLWGNREAKPVVMKQAVLKTEPWKEDETPPVLNRLEHPLAHVLMSQALSVADIEEYAEFPNDDNGFILTGYFRPPQKLTRLVLSATVPVEVDIYLVPLLDIYEEDLLYTLKARDGIAGELVQLLDPALLYKVIVVGYMSMGEYYDVSLMQYDPGNKFSGVGVDLMIPDLDKVLHKRTEEGEMDKVSDLASTSTLKTVDSISTSEILSCNSPISDSGLKDRLSDFCWSVTSDLGAEPLSDDFDRIVISETGG